MKLGLTSRMAIDAVTHMVPFLPNFHLNGNLDKEAVMSLRNEAQPLLEKWGIRDRRIY